MKNILAVLIALGLAAPTINARAGQLIILDNEQADPFVAQSVQPLPESVESLPGEVKHIFEVLVLLPEVTGEEPVGNSAEMIEVVDVPMDPVEPEESSFWAGVQEDFAFNFSSPKKRWLNLGAFSKHSGKRLDTGHDYNEQNTGLGYEWAATEHVNYGFGFYNNSYDQSSVYASVFRELFSVGRLRGGLTAGLVTGYPRASVLPFLFPTLAYEHDRFGVNLSYSPSVSSKGEQMTTDVLILQLKFAF